MVDKNEIMISVQMLSYNHENTIARAIESVINQKTQYKYELVIGDDASTDRSQSIILKYAEKYPDKIIAICRDKNIGSIKNGCDTFSRCRGKYLAICEGDDYWIDDNKLETQVGFLENHPDYSACYSKAKMFVNGKIIEYPFANEGCESIEDMLNKGDIKRYISCTFVSRNYYKDNSLLLGYLSKGIVGDIITQTIAASYGKIGYIEKEFAVYERETGGDTSFSSNSLEQQVSSIRIAIDCCKAITGNRYDKLWDRYMAGFACAVWREKKIENVYEAIKWVISNCKVPEICYILQKLFSDYVQTKRWL